MQTSGKVYVMLSPFTNKTIKCTEFTKEKWEKRGYFCIEVKQGTRNNIKR